MSISQTIFSLLDLTTLRGQIFQAIFQIIFWRQIFKLIINYVTKNYSKTKWYQHAISKGAGETQPEQEALLKNLLCAAPQHSVSALLIGLGIYFDSHYLFSMGTLSEFAYEFIDLSSCLMGKYVYYNSPYTAAMINALVFHHLPGILVIIPVNLYFGDNVHIRNLAFSLLALAPLLLLFMFLQQTRNVRDLQERAQFTIYLFITIIIMIYSRFYWTPLLIIDFIFDGFMELSLMMQIMFAFYGILINMFNILGCFIFGQRLYAFLYCNKCLNKKEKPMAIKKITEMMPMLARCRSTPLFQGYSAKKYS